jgi:hypothetical protein
MHNAPFSTMEAIFEMTGKAGSCTYKDWGHFCIPDSGLYSLAMHKDTLYILTDADLLYRVDLTTGSCGYLADLARNGTSATISALTSDKNGILYGIDGINKSLYRYDPHTDQFDLMGTLPAPPAGDMLFYGDTLLYAANLFTTNNFQQTIYAVNINNPAASPPFMSVTGYSFYGMIALPADCSHNKLYGVTDGANAQLIELDPVHHQVTGLVCQFPFNALDAASTLEDGSFARISIDSLSIQAACGAAATGSLQVFSSGIGQDATTYILDGGPSNTTGSFSNISMGTHSIRIQSTSSLGCLADTIFVLGKGLSDRKKDGWRNGTAGTIAWPLTR